jgi:predicted nucleotide-binding protein/Tfp pilus assembly protein PilF
MLRSLTITNIPMAKPKIFIGSSVEGLSIAYSIQQNLTHDAEITVWSQGVFELSQTSIESLVNVLEKSDFAIFVFSPDDIIKMRKEEFLVVRDNVIFELGLFIGKLGRQRSFIIMPDKIMPDKPAFHMLTDLVGVTAGKYETARSDGNYEAATGPACQQIRTQIKKLGLLQNVSREPTVEKETSVPVKEDKIKENSWWNFYLDDEYDNALELIEKDIETTSDVKEKEDLKFWKMYTEYKIDPTKGREQMYRKVQAESDNVNTYIIISRILLWEDELDYASKIIDEGLTKFKKNEILVSRKTEYLEKIGRVEEAISLILNTDYEASEDLTIKLAELYETSEDKKIDEALSIIKKAYLKNPSSKKLTYKLARLAQDTNKNEIALYLFDKLTKKYPIVAEYWGYLGNACNDLDLANKAMIAYKKADDLYKPKESWVLENIGNLLMNKGLFSDARQYFSQALEIEPNSEYSFTRVAGIIKLDEEENDTYSALIKQGLNLIAKPNLPAAENSVL